jgi:hypothetical protein
LKKFLFLVTAAIFERRAGLSDTFLKGTHPRTIPARLGLIWFRGFRGEDLNVKGYDVRLSNLTWGKNDQHSKIYLPCNFEVNDTKSDYPSWSYCPFFIKFLKFKTTMDAK